MKFHNQDSAETHESSSRLVTNRNSQYGKSPKKPHKEPLFEISFIKVKGSSNFKSNLSGYPKFNGRYTMDNSKEGSSPKYSSIATYLLTENKEVLASKLLNRRSVTIEGLAKRSPRRKIVGNQESCNAVRGLIESP